jgi:hypothetical protein
MVGFFADKSQKEKEQLFYYGCVPSRIVLAGGLYLASIPLTEEQYRNMILVLSVSVFFGFLYRWMTSPAWWNRSVPVVLSFIAAIAALKAPPSSLPVIVASLVLVHLALGIYSFETHAEIFK